MRPQRWHWTSTVTVKWRINGRRWSISTVYLPAQRSWASRHSQCELYKLVKYSAESYGDFGMPLTGKFIPARSVRYGVSDFFAANFSAVKNRVMEINRQISGQQSSDRAYHKQNRIKIVMLRKWRNLMLILTSQVSPLPLSKAKAAGWDLLVSVGVQAPTEIAA